MLVVKHFWRELGIDNILKGLGGRGKEDGMALSERAQVLVGNRLCCPSSEHGLARWLETDFVCDQNGRRWMPSWRDDEERKNSNLPRVRVELKQLKQWYRTLDQLIKRKSDIETQLFCQLRNLFSLKVDLVLYDLTSTYFEGHGPPKKGAHGHSRDGKSRNRQVLVGCVMVDGWPIAHHVFAGNRRDSTTVPYVLSDLKQRFGLRRVVFVGDRGMVTVDNLELIRKTGNGYIVGRNRRRSEEVFQYIDLANQVGDWKECPVGITSQEKTDPPKTMVQEVPSLQEGARVFVVRSDERLDYEQGQRKRAMQRVRQALEKLSMRVAKGQIKKPEKIGAAAERILKRHHGHRYYAWELKDGQFRFFEHPVNLKREQMYEGTYVIQTEEKYLSAVQVVTFYKELMEVERAFRNLKDVIDLRPIYHQIDDRVDGHIFVAVLAFLIQRATEKKLKAAGLDSSANEAFQLLRTIRVVDIDLGNGTTKRSVTKGTARAAKILRALGISNLVPPIPSEEGIRYV
jgi:transposase